MSMGEMLIPELYNNCLSFNTISWHYPFKISEKIFKKAAGSFISLVQNPVEAILRITAPWLETQSRQTGEYYMYRYLILIGM
jgi:hypothetical protein